MLIDEFVGVVQDPLVIEGWTIDAASRYEPTTASGLTPTGKAFTLRLDGDTCTLTIAGRAKSITRSLETWRPASATLQAVRDLYVAFPTNQR